MMRTFPQAVDFIVTNRCNLHCPVCWGSGMPDFKPVSLEKRLEMIGILSKGGVDTISFTGGEPMLEDSLPELMGEADCRGMRIILFTNTTLIDKKGDETIPYADKVSYSLDGYNEETNSLARRPGHFNDVLHALDLMQAKYPGKQTQVITVVTQENKRFLENIGKLLEEKTPGMDFDWKLNYYFLMGRQNPRFALPYLEFKELGEEIKQRFSRSFKVKYSLANHDNSYFFIFPDGNLYTAQGTEYTPIGNIFAPETYNRNLLREIEINSSARRGKEPRLK